MVVRALYECSFTFTKIVSGCKNSDIYDQQKQGINPDVFQNLNFPNVRGKINTITVESIVERLKHRTRFLLNVCAMLEGTCLIDKRKGCTCH